MPAAVRSGLTLLGLAAILVVAAGWGWQAVTRPFPGSEEAPLCSETTVRTGDKVTRDQVAISVYNGSARNGLASATMEQLVDRGFVAADSDNAPAKIDGVEIWSDEPRNAAVRLVASQFEGAKVVSGKKLGRGIVVVVGESFEALRKKSPRAVTAVAESTFCSPPESE